MAKIRKINVSEIAGRSPFDQDDNSIMPAGTVVVYEDNGKYVLRVHDGVTDGGVALSAGAVPVIFNGNDGIVLNNLNEDIAALFNNGDVYITGGEGLRFTGINEVDGFDVSMLRFWNGEGRHSTDNDPTELVTLNVGNDAAQGDPTEGFFKIVTEKETGSNKTWKFDSDGVLTLPVSGDIVDSTGASVLGGGSSVDNNIWIETFTSTDPEESIVQIANSVEYDADGNIFALFSHLIPGVPPQETYTSVAKLSPTGSVLWQVRFGANLNTDGWGLAYDGSDTVYVAGSTSGTPLTYNLATLTKIDAADGTIVWNKTYDFEANSRSAVVDVDSDLNPVMVGWADTPGEENNRVITTKVDQADGSVVWSRTLDGQGDDEAYGMAVGPTGEVVAVGYMSQYDEVGEPYPVTPQTGSGVNRLVINRSDLSNDTFTDTWQVAGTGITGYIGVSQINAYTGLTGTVQQGSGAVFEIADNGDGTYVISGLLNGGTNYLAGHKIKILGTDLGGATPDNDCIIAVDSIDPGGVVFLWSVSGTAAGSAFNIYTPLTGTNYQTGSGLEFDLELDSGSTYTQHPFNITAAGTNYVDGDVVVIPGTQLGGTSPENDLTATVSTDAGGVTQFNSFTGTQQTTTYRIITDDAGVDFSGTGTWTLNDVSVDTDDRMLVVKYAANGDIVWQKAVEIDSNYSCRGADADIDADGNIYVCGSYDNFGGSAMSLVKLNSSGVKQWSRQVIGNCQDFATSVVVGPDNNLYLSGVTIDNGNEDINWVVAKYSATGTVVWQRLINNTASWTFAGGGFIGDGGGSNIAVGTDYVALGGGFGVLENESPTATVVQISTAGTPFSTGDWELIDSSFSGTLDDTASSITVLDAGKTAGTATPTVEDFVVMDDTGNFLTVTRYSLAGGNDSLVNGEYTLVLGNTGTVTLPAGGTITEGVVTSNPTIQLTPASPDVASQKLVIKGGGAYTASNNGIGLNWNEINPLVGDTVQIYVNSDTYASETLYWWVSPAGAGILDTESGTVVLSGSSGEFSILIDSEDYEFRIRVSPEDNNYDPASLGVETQLFNSGSPTFDSEHHLHLTTGDLTETSIFLGTDDHNVRTTVNGDIEITTPNQTNNVWRFDNEGEFTVPDSSVIKSASYSGFSLRSRYDEPLDNLVGSNMLVSPGQISINYQVEDQGVPTPGYQWDFNYVTQALDLAAGGLKFADNTVQTTAYAGGQGHMMMIDTNRTDTYTEVGSADRPFKTFAAAIAAAAATGETTFTFVLMGCTVTEDVDFDGTAFTSITISTACRSNIEGNISIANNSDLSQLVVRNVEIGGTFTLTGDGTANQMNNCSFYNTSFSGAVSITATNATAFYEAAFFGTVAFTNLSYLYINGAQFNTDWTITADDTGTYPIPSRGINPGTGGSIAIVFSTIANNVNFVKGGTAVFVFQPHMSRMGVSAGTYTVPAGWTMTPHSTVLRGTWVNNGTVAMRNSSSDLAITGNARAYTGIIGGDRVVADLVPANSTGAAGDAAGMIAVGGGYLYVCTANWASPGTADIWTRTLLTTGSW